MSDFSKNDKVKVLREGVFVKGKVTEVVQTKGYRGSYNYNVVHVKLEDDRIFKFNEWDVVLDKDK